MNPSRLAVTAFASTLFAAVAFAQPAPPPPPLPPAAGGSASGSAVAGDPDLEPQVTILRRDTETVEEVRIGGELRFIRVTPREGRPYYLIPQQGGTQFIRRDSLDPSVRVPMWMLFSW